MSTSDFTLSEVIDLHVAAEMEGHFHSVPARIVSYDTATQTATVEPTTKVVSRNAEGDRIVDTLPVMPAIPVAMPRGGGWVLHMPLEKGDSGLLVVTDHDLGAWRGSGQVSDSGDERRHALGGVVFFPGAVVPVADAIPGLPGDAMVLGRESGPQIHIDASTVQLGAAGGNFVALANKVDQIVQDILTAAAAASPAAFQAAIAAHASGPSAWTSTAAAKVKAT